MKRWNLLFAVGLVVAGMGLVGSVSPGLAQERGAVERQATQAVERKAAIQRATIQKSELISPKHPGPKVSEEQKLASPGGSPRYECTYYSKGNITECVCKGMLDCGKLWDSGKCDGGTKWEDGNDPSVGGCDVPGG